MGDENVQNVGIIVNQLIEIGDSGVIVYLGGKKTGQYSQPQEQSELSGWHHLPATYSLRKSFCCQPFYFSIQRF